MTNKEYVEVEAVVRVPKGARLADSRESEGWSRGFTPKSTGKGPEHVEIRLKDETDTPDRESEVVYVTEYVESPRRELTPSEQVFADFIVRLGEDLLFALRPIAVEWFKTQAVPALRAKRDKLRQTRRDRRAAKTVLVSAIEPEAHSAEPTLRVTVAIGEPKMALTSEQFQMLFMTWLEREDAQKTLWKVLANADIEDGDAATLNWQRRFAALSAQERTDRAGAVLSANPAILNGMDRLLAQGDTATPVELTLRTDEAQRFSRS